MGEKERFKFIYVHQPHTSFYIIWTDMSDMVIVITDNKNSVCRYTEGKYHFTI